MSKTPDGLGGYTLGLIVAGRDDRFRRPAARDRSLRGLRHERPVHVDRHQDGLVPIASPSTASFSVTAPVASQYYSVIAVDARGNKSSF